jgi:hypothetical protein
MPDDSQQDAAALARLAGLDLPSERRLALQLGLVTVRTAVHVLMERDYGEAEPADRFRPRPDR